jgi:gamma-glutamyltranspeptidase/glutathione hydrolase
MVCSRFAASMAVVLIVALTGCSYLGLGDSTSTPAVGLGFLGLSGNNARAVGRGLVVGDEPLAVQTGANVLTLGGSAADAATAMYFALAATYPVTAGLGGGGLCVVHDATAGKNEAIDFLVRNAVGGGAFGVPGNVRGFSVLQASYGRLPWQRDVAPGEGYAAAGFAISQALETRLRESQDTIRLDANLAAEFLDESGQVRPEGALVTNTDLGATLAAVRGFGPDSLYRGATANKLVSYSSAQGGAFTSVELAGYPVGREAPATVVIGDQTAYLPPVTLGAGAFARALLAHLVDGQGQIITGANPANAVAVATKVTLEQFGLGALPRDLGATGFAAADSYGQAVACAVTMNGPFGSGHTAAGTGVTLARAPSAEQTGLSGAFLTPIIATSDGALSLAGAGAGGPNGTAAIVYAQIRLALGDDITQPGHLHSTGLAPYDTINAVACQSGACAALPDPAAHGLGAEAPQ